MAKRNKHTLTSEENVKMLFPKPVAAIVGDLYHNAPQTIIAEGDPNHTAKQSWEQLNDISLAIGQGIAQMASDIHTTVEMVKQLGCDHIREFNAVVEKTNQDFQKFIGDYEKIRARHIGKSGFIETGPDLALSLSVFEDYQQFRAFFDGAMHHTLISFTEYALEAKDRALKMQSEQPEKSE